MKDGKVDRFKVDENGLTVDGYRCLEPESKRSMYLGNMITMIISAAIVLLIVMYGDSWLGDYYDIVCIGHPIWSGSMPMALYGFFESAGFPLPG